MEIKKHTIILQTNDKGNLIPMKERRIIIKKNAAKCLICGDTVESTDKLNLVTCSCGNIAVTGGYDYLCRTYIFKDKFEDISEISNTTNE